MSTIEQGSRSLNERVTIVFDGVEGGRIVTRRQFDKVWADRGWTIQSDAPAKEPSAARKKIAEAVAQTTEAPKPTETTTEKKTATSTPSQ